MRWEDKTDERGQLKGAGEYCTSHARATNQSALNAQAIKGIPRSHLQTHTGCRQGEATICGSSIHPPTPRPTAL